MLKLRPLPEGRDGDVLSISEISEEESSVLVGVMFETSNGVPPETVADAGGPQREIPIRGMATDVFESEGIRDEGRTAAVRCWSGRDPSSALKSESLREDSVSPEPARPSSSVRSTSRSRTTGRCFSARDHDQEPRLKHPQIPPNAGDRRGDEDPRANAPSPSCHPGVSRPQ